MRFTTMAVAALSILFLVPACADPLPSASIITDLRLLAIVAEPPEANPGQTVALTPLVVDPQGREISYEWAACVVPASADDDEAEYDTEDCLLRLENGEPGVTHLGTGPTAEYTVPDDFYDDPSVIGDAYGFDEEIPPEFQLILAALIGVEVIVSLNVSVPGETLRAYKRIKVSTSAAPNENPEPVSFVLRKRPTQAERDAEGFEPQPILGPLNLPEPGRCLIERDGPPTINTVDDWEIVPATLPNEYPTYSVVGVSPDPDQPFQVVETDEVYVMQFFSTAGSLQNRSDTFVDPDDTEPPDELPGTVNWSLSEAPEGATSLPLWIITRDGRGGTVVCQDDVLIDRSAE